MVLKVLALALLIGAGFFIPGGGAGRGMESLFATDPAGAGGGSGIVIWAFGAALLPVMFSFGGWQNANYVAEEIKNPRKNLPISLLVVWNGTRQPIETDPLAQQQVEQPDRGG